MTLQLSSELLQEIQAHGEAAYPEEGAGLMLGTLSEEHKRVSKLMKFANAREQSARHNRYMLTPQDYLRGEQEAARLGLDVVGVFHSHPDHPNRPSEFDRDWAMPVFSYVITSVQSGEAAGSRSWVLNDERVEFQEERITTFENLTSVDHSGIKTSQASIIALNILAFVFDAPWVAILVTLVMALGTLIKRPGFGFIYQLALKPLGWLKPEVLQDNPEPHRFAQGLGSLFMAFGSLALWLGAPVIGWGLIWLVTALAALNLFAGFCVGCMIYYWLSRLHVPGFHKAPPQGAIPGMRPKRRIPHES